ncbi:MAG: hypothetical protein HWN67_06905 [Candidatus Helarchaeota archaeon]|nr:hypothetical protein [Candidatus Helarchaeota archaeon]
MSTDMILGYLLGLQAEMQPTPDLVGSIIGIILLAIWIVVTILLWRDIKEVTIDDTAKILWVMFLLLPIISWIAYYLVLKK